MRTIAIVNEKGGTAKTTTTVNLAAALAQLGHRTLVVDLDGQAASSRWLGVEDDPRLADALIRGGGLEPIENLRPNLDLAPACGKIDSVAHELRPTQGGRLRRVLAELDDRYDFALIDCPPSLGNRLIGNAMLAAGEALVPVETSILALDGLRLLLTMLGDIREGFGHDIRLLGVLACRYDVRTRLSRLVLAEMQRGLPGRVFRSIIRVNTRLQECPATQMTILEYAPQSSAATDYLALAREVVAGGAQASRDEAPDVEQSAYAELDTADRNTLQAFRQRAAAHLGRQRPPASAPEPEAADVPTETAPAEAIAAPPEQDAFAPVVAPAAPVATEPDEPDPPVEAPAESRSPGRSALVAAVSMMIIVTIGWVVAHNMSGGAQPAPAAAPFVPQTPPVELIPADAVDDPPAEPQPAPVAADDDDAAPPQATADANDAVDPDPVATAQQPQPEPAADDEADAQGTVPRFARRLTSELAAAFQAAPTAGAAEPADPVEPDARDAVKSEAQETAEPEAAAFAPGGAADETEPLTVTPAGDPQEYMQAQLSGTMLGPDRSVAIINGRVVRVGDAWRGARLVEVKSSRATLEHAGVRYHMIVGGPTTRTTVDGEPADDAEVQP